MSFGKARAFVCRTAMFLSENFHSLPAADTVGEAQATGHLLLKVFLATSVCVVWPSTLTHCEASTTSSVLLLQR